MRAVHVRACARVVVIPKTLRGQDKLGKDDKISTLLLSAGEILRLCNAMGRKDVALMPAFNVELTLPLRSKHKKSTAATITLALAVTWPAELHAVSCARFVLCVCDSGSCARLCCVYEPRERD